MAPSPSPQALPPFTGDKPICAKCSYGQAFTEYKAKHEPRSGDVIGGHGLPERLERRCARCDFVWDEALNPPTQDGA